MSNFNHSSIHSNSQNFNQVQSLKNQSNTQNFNSNAYLLSNNQISNQESHSLHNKNCNAEIISKSIVYGSIAFWLGKKSEQNLTHKWCVYVRGINNEDISYFVKEVVFTLHATFENNVRKISKWPFELYASGWGEFDIKITIHLIDETIKPIEFIHFLKLYPPANQTPSTKKPIVSEFFDEIVFVNPKKNLRECLLDGSSNPGNLKRDTSIQIPLNLNKYDDDKRSEISNSEENKNKPANSTILDNKMESLNIGNAIHNNFNSNDSHDLNFNTNLQINDDVEMEHSEQNQNFNQYSGNMIPNNDSVSVFSNNINENIEKKSEEKIKSNPNYIPNMYQYFSTIDDSAHLKLLEDANNFVTKEIQKLRKELEIKDRDINLLKKSLREFSSKSNL